MAIHFRVVGGRITSILLEADQDSLRRLDVDDLEGKDSDTRR